MPLHCTVCLSKLLGLIFLVEMEGLIYQMQLGLQGNFPYNLVDAANIKRKVLPTYFGYTVVPWITNASPNVIFDLRIQIHWK